MNILVKFLRKVCRSLSRVVFPNVLRICLLRLAGVRIGKDVFINEGLTLASIVGQEELLVIDDRAALGPNNIIILTTDPNFSNLRKLKKAIPSIESRGKVHIKHDVWIGAGCIILPNITIGEYSIIGAGSVVTRDVPPGSIAVGVPAKVIKDINNLLKEGNLSE